MDSDESKNLTHEEIWDDSMLIDSWNQALDEYKRYHSIYAQGGTLKDLEAELAKKESQEPDKEDGPEASTDAPIVDTKDVPVLEQTEEQPQQRSNLPTPLPPSFPKALLAGVGGDALKPLLMSWYYAGYYTGLFEGQQQSQQSQQNQQKE